jgi:hypothetical protein
MANQTHGAPNVSVSVAAQNHEPTGDPDHVAYGQDFVWRCSCGQSSAFLARLDKQTYRAEQHSRYCDGRTRVEVRD